jgi:hypothetical protein
MEYAAYCKDCNAITGTAVNGLKSNCMKCGIEKNTPVFRWCAGILLLTALAVFSLWVIFVGIYTILQVL